MDLTINYLQYYHYNLKLYLRNYYEKIIRLKNKSIYYIYFKL